MVSILLRSGSCLSHITLYLTFQGLLDSVRQQRGPQPTFDALLQLCLTDASPCWWPAGCKNVCILLVALVTVPFVLAEPQLNVSKARSDYTRCSSLCVTLELAEGFGQADAGLHLLSRNVMTGSWHSDTEQNAASPYISTHQQLLLTRDGMAFQHMDLLLLTRSRI